MNDVLYIAWRYLAFNRWKTGILIAAITVILFLPLALELVLDRSSERLRARAEATPLLLGAPGIRGAAVGAAVMVGGVDLISRRSRLAGDSAVGLMFVAMLALGVVIVSRSDRSAATSCRFSSATSSASGRRWT